MRPPKIAVVAFSAPPHSAGGVAAAHFNLFRALQEEGNQTRLFTFGEPDLEDEADIVRSGTAAWLVRFLLKINGRVFGLLQPGKRAYQTADIVTSLIGAWRMSREISEFGPDVIILSDHGAPGLMLKKPKGSKIILVSHHNPARFVAHPELADFSRLDAIWALRLEQSVLRKIDAVVCPSKYMKDWFQRSYRFSGPILVIPNLLNQELLDRIAEVDIREQLSLKPDAALIYMPSAASRTKGAQYVLQIIRGILTENKDPIGFYIPGDATTEWIDEIAELPQQVQVCLAGQVPYEEHIANMKSCTFGISPSLLENYSMALLEAVTCGVPMVAFDTGGNADIIHNGENGYLAPEGDVVSLVELVHRLLNNADIEGFKKKTRVYSRTNLAPEKALNSYLELIESL
jgi:glycosyltransferase involved in cell wall biosynthesis